MSDAYVWIDPARCSGEPCIGGTRINVAMVAGAVWTHGVDNAMDLWCLSRGQVLGACWFAGAGNVVRIHGKSGKYVGHRGPWAKRWGAWAKEVHGHLWKDDLDAVVDPPTSKESA